VWVIARSCPQAGVTTGWVGTVTARCCLRPVAVSPGSAGDDSMRADLAEARRDVPDEAGGCGTRSPCRGRLGF